ncbi:hypothetical protein GOBAR_AA29960 [Gossypium barbadense]|uniref:Uncharacterized protein n=1 Tax=Gossypium barbadense TaxID=3634 RepID=A0A2P5WI23_GOSBA|nr:hypothetical protein GOBAR_AA29960 [Gossypium barbadense]
MCNSASSLMSQARSRPRHECVYFQLHDMAINSYNGYDVASYFLPKHKDLRESRKTAGEHIPQKWIASATQSSSLQSIWANSMGQANEAAEYLKLEEASVAAASNSPQSVEPSIKARTILFADGVWKRKKKPSIPNRQSRDAVSTTKLFPPNNASGRLGASDSEWSNLPQTKPGRSPKPFDHPTHLLCRSHPPQNLHRGWAYVCADSPEGLLSADSPGSIGVVACARFSRDGIVAKCMIPIPSRFKWLGA